MLLYAAKSNAMAMSVIIHVTAQMRDERIALQKLDRSASRQAKKAKKAAIGCRTMPVVSKLAVPVPNVSFP